MFLTLLYATLAQLGERCTCNADVVGSSPTSSLLKTFSDLRKWPQAFGRRESHSKS